jgi:capsid protein
LRLGYDLDDVYAERAEEMKMREKLGLPEPAIVNAGGRGNKAKEEQGDASSDN